MCTSRRFAVVMFLLSASSSAVAGARTVGLTVDHLIEAGNVTDPVFGWKMESDRPGARQTAWRIEVSERGVGAVWDSGEREGDISSGIVYGGPKLRSARHHDWTVRVKDESGMWLEPAHGNFVTGARSEDWSGSEWISDPSPVVRGAGLSWGSKAPEGTRWFLKTVRNEHEVREAFWLTSALGVYDLYVNGKPVGNDFLKPGSTVNGHRRQSLTYDVTSMIATRGDAENVFAAEVSSAWWNDLISAHKGGERTAFRGVLVLRFANGSEKRIGTGAEWGSFVGGRVVRAGILEGEECDARRPFPPDHPESFRPSVVNSEFKGVISPLIGPSVRLRRDLALDPVEAYVWKGVTDPLSNGVGRVKILRRYGSGERIDLAPGETLVTDFGQNATTVPSFEFSADEGTTLEARFGEILNPDTPKDGRRRADGPRGSLYRRNLDVADMKVRYTFAGRGHESYQPRFTFFGCRYASITASAPVTISRLRLLPVSSISRDAELSTFETENPDLDRLAQNCLWSLRGNYLSVPMDCPSRAERLGWSGDAQVFSEAAAYLADTYSFMEKWMTDHRDAQDETGGFRSAAPVGRFGDGTFRFGWGDAGVICPYRVWQHSGDVRIVREHWEAMSRFVRRIDATRYRHEDGHAKSSGDWLTFEKYNRWGLDGEDLNRWDGDPGCRRFFDFLAGCYWFADARMMSEMGDAIGRGSDADFFRASAARAMRMLRTEFLDARGLLVSPLDGMQAALVFALRFGVVERQAAERTSAALLENISAHGGCLQTGILGTGFILDALAVDARSPEAAYSLLLQRKCPSWLFMVDNGATAVWERWDGFVAGEGALDSGMCSFNHYAFGSVFGWMCRAMGGIAPDPASPGFHHFMLAPRPDRRIGKARVSYESPYGRISSDWRYEADGTWKWTFTIPANSSATVVDPAGGRRECASGTHEIKIAPRQEWRISVDPDMELGPIRRMNAVNNGPNVARSDQTRSTFDDFRKLGIPYARIHDANHSSAYGGPHCCDITAVFPDFEADETKPENYDFAITDEYLGTIRKAGTEVFFRLGQSIEHWIRKYGVNPPKDYAKWARICEHVIAHYTEGWADGFYWTIDYWELWNEPDGNQPTSDGRLGPNWTGSKEQFFELYRVAATHLKRRFPHLRIGGPAMTGSFSWTDFIPFCATNGIPLDFYSFHDYAKNPEGILDHVRQARRLLDENGFSSAEAILDEWNYLKNWTDGWIYTLECETGRLSHKGAAFIAATMIACQHEPVDMLMFYDARVSCPMNSMFDPVTFKPLRGYYPFLAWKRLRELGTEVKVAVDAPGNGLSRLYACAAKGRNGESALFLARFTESDDVTAVRHVRIRPPRGADPAKARCHLTDTARIHSETPPEVSADGTLSIRLEPNAFAFIEFPK